MIGYKKCVYFSGDGHQVRECIVELRIPNDARVVRPWIGHRANKLRCDRAFVRAIFSYDEFGNYDRLPDDTVVYSISSLTYFVNHLRTEYLTEAFKRAFKYVVGETVTPEYDLNDDIYYECGSGIHFFETIEEAVNYRGLWVFIFDIKDAFERFNKIERVDKNDRL